MLGFWFDIEGEEFHVSVNGVEQGGNNYNIANLTGWPDLPNYIPMMGRAGSYDEIYHWNFGQGDPDGENNFTDSEGRGGFRFEPPEDFLSLCTANMSDDDYAPIGPNGVAGNPDKHFDTLIWTGGGVPTNVRGLNFQPDLVWIKPRGQGWSHKLYDSLRGVTKRFETDGNGAEGTEATGLTSFNPDGFTVGNEYHGTDTANNYVAFCWKAGNGTVENGDGNIRSTISVNQDAGFSIVSYDGSPTGTSDSATNGGAYWQVGHGLGKTPELIVIKQRTGSNGWYVGHIGLGSDVWTAGKSLAFQTTAAVSTAANILWGTGQVDEKVFSLGGWDTVNRNGHQYIAYCWTGIEGYSKFGTYKGNNNADGPFVYTGFKPAFTICKRFESSSGANWLMHDNKRDPINPVDRYLVTDGSGTEGVNHAGTSVDYLSNGFKMRGDDSATNASGGDYIYIAFAEMPFKYATAR